jgi:peptide/nickel transport system substrate-binding protein/oligopeptide transport system substrate-binding protein
MAKQLFQQGMKEEGYTQATFPAITFTVASQGNVESRNVYAAAQQMWKTALGITVKIDDIDFNKALDVISAANNNPKGLQMWSIAWAADYPDAQVWTTLQFDNGVSSNNMNYGQNKSSNAATQQQTQKLLEQADGNLNPTSRIQQYNQAEQQLVNDVAWLPIDQRIYTQVVKPCVVGFVENDQSNNWGNVYITNATPCANTSQYQ